MDTAFVILAAGKGTRMRSGHSKVLHPIAGQAMLAHTIRLAQTFTPKHLVLVSGHRAEEVTQAAHRLAPQARTVVQEPQLGTGHAAMQTREVLEAFTGNVFFVYADTPLITAATLEKMANARAQGARVVVLGFEAADPRGYGRLITGNAGLEAIIEDKEATPDQRAIRFCNSGVLCVDGAILFDLLSALTNANAKGEYYLTDIVALARAREFPCAAIACQESEVCGVNTRADLAVVEDFWQQRRRLEAMESGVSLIAPQTVFFSYDTVLEPDVTVEPHVFFGKGVHISEGAYIRGFSHLEGCRVASKATVGPYARLRPGSDIGEGCHIGNFVEVKNAVLDSGAKANHLSYIGDAHVGAKANIGAGTITCNYDGKNKHRTSIGAGAFIGSNTSLVAPVDIGDESLIGAGSVITQSVPQGALALTRAQQRIIPDGVALRNAQKPPETKS